MHLEEDQVFSPLHLFYDKVMHGNMLTELDPKSYCSIIARRGSLSIENIVKKQKTKQV